VQVLNAQLPRWRNVRTTAAVAYAAGRSDSYLEASATAGFAYGILKAVRKRYVGQEYARLRKKRFAVVKNISPEGELLQVSFGTGMGSNLILSPDPADFDAVWSGHGDAVSDGVSAQVFLLAHWLRRDDRQGFYRQIT
jgi:hypothetical protein